MCKSTAEGGQRCAGRARVRLEKAVHAAREAHTAYQSNRTQKGREAVLAAAGRVRDAEADYASTPQGQSHFMTELQTARQSSDAAKERQILDTLAEGSRGRAQSKAIAKSTREVSERGERQAAGYGSDAAQAKSPHHAKVLAATAREQAALDRLSAATLAHDEDAAAIAWNDVGAARQDVFAAECAFASTPVGQEHYRAMSTGEPHGSVAQQHGEYILAMSSLGL